MNYFTNIEGIDNKFIGSVYNKTNSTLLYRTQKHSVLKDVQDEIAQFLKTVPSPSSQPQKVQKRCCGR